MADVCGVGRRTSSGRHSCRSRRASAATRRRRSSALEFVASCALFLPVGGCADCDYDEYEVDEKAQGPLVEAFLESDVTQTFSVVVRADGDPDALSVRMRVSVAVDPEARLDVALACPQLQLRDEVALGPVESGKPLRIPVSVSLPQLPFEHTCSFEAVNRDPDRDLIEIDWQPELIATFFKDKDYVPPELSVEVEE